MKDSDVKAEIKKENKKKKKRYFKRKKRYIKENNKIRMYTTIKNGPAVFQEREKKVKQQKRLGLESEVGQPHIKAGFA